MRWWITTMTAVLALLGGPIRADDGSETTDELDQRLKVIERKLELDQEQRKEKEKSASAVSVSGDGFTLKSADGAYVLKLRGYVQLDGRFFLDDEERPATDTLLVRRARPVLEGTLAKIFDFKIMPDFGGGQSLLYDGYVEGRFSKAFRLRAGKFKPPIGLERLQSATDIVFIERAAPTLLVPSRDLGVQLGGELAGSKLEYAVGIFNGVVDGGLADSDSTDDKELAGRLFWRPFQPSDGSVPRFDLGLGVAASSGDELGSVTAPQLPAFRSLGQQTIFSYRTDATVPGTVIADGGHERLAPQAWFYSGPFGLLAEWVSSEQGVRKDLATATLEHEAWQIQASWVVTGERNGFKGVAPRNGFGGSDGGSGAWIVAVRATEIDFDDAAFPIYADPTRSATKASALGVALSWNLVKGARWMVDYNVVRYDGGATNGDRPDEKALFTRFQIAF